MNYPAKTIVQNYNVAAGRVIQLPCFADQSQPPDGFRAVVFATPVLGTNGPYVNQVGPDFTINAPAAVQFDLTQLVQNASLSRIRSIYAQCTVPMGNATSGSPATYQVALDSGLLIPCAPGPIQSDAFCVADFISANPVFALLASEEAMASLGDAQFTVCVANFKLSASAFAGAVVNGV